jgi:hypothetical protein
VLPDPERLQVGLGFVETSQAGNLLSEPDCTSEAPDHDSSCDSEEVTRFITGKRCGSTEFQVLPDPERLQVGLGLDEKCEAWRRGVVPDTTQASEAGM